MLCASCTVVYTVSYGLTRSLTVLYDRLYDYTRTSHPCQFFKSFKNHTRLTRIHSNGPSVSRIRPRFIRLYVRFTRMANRVNLVFCVRRALSKMVMILPVLIASESPGYMYYMQNTFIEILLYVCTIFIISSIATSSSPPL